MLVEEAGKEVPLVVVAVALKEEEGVKTSTEVTKKGTIIIVENLFILSSFVVLVSTMKKMTELESLIIIVVIIEMKNAGIAP